MCEYCCVWEGGVVSLVSSVAVVVLYILDAAILGARDLLFWASGEVSRENCVFWGR
jgi:hypothetical protein